MTHFLFKSAGEHRHGSRRVGGRVDVDDVAHTVRAIDEQTFTVQVNGQTSRWRAVAHGDTVHLQRDGRACVVERVDATRSRASGGAAGGAQAPMPGVVVSWVVQPGAAVAKGDALLVIESMKLQMTIAAPHGGTLQELPFAAGQTFQRGAVLAVVRAENPTGDSA